MTVDLNHSCNPDEEYCDSVLHVKYGACRDANLFYIQSLDHYGTWQQKFEITM